MEVGGSQVEVRQHHAAARFSQRDREVGGNQGFPHPALSAGDRHDVHAPSYSISTGSGAGTGAAGSTLAVSRG